MPTSPVVQSALTGSPLVVVRRGAAVEPVDDRLGAERLLLVAAVGQPSESTVPTLSPSTTAYPRGT